MSFVQRIALSPLVRRPQRARACAPLHAALFTIAALAVLLLPLADGARAQSSASVASTGSDWRWADFSRICPPSRLECAVSVYGGRFNDTDMTLAFGVKGLKAPWEWTFANSSLLAATFDRNLFHFGGYARLEGELGVAQRFGRADAQEIWSALYLRWIAFPWSAYLRTSAAVSTGLSLSSKVDEFERIQSQNGRGSRLLHYFSPEITVGLPSNERLDLIVRWHHRSGGGMFADIAMFNGVGDGVNYLSAGIRYRF